MSDIHIEHKHNFDLATARSQAKKWLNEAQQQLGLDIDYQEGDSQDTATLNKSGVSATAVLTEQSIVFDASLGFLAKPFKSQIINSIQADLHKYFA